MMNRPRGGKNYKSVSNREKQPESSRGVISNVHVSSSLYKVLVYVNDVVIRHIRPILRRANGFLHLFRDPLVYLSGRSRKFRFVLLAGVMRICVIARLKDFGRRFLQI